MIGSKGTHYILPPAEQQRDRDGNPVLDDRGKPRWIAHIDLRNSAVRERFQGQVIEALRVRHQEVFTR